DGDLHGVAEELEVFQRHLLHLVSRVATLEVRTEAVTLNRLREDDGGLTLVLHRRLVRGVDLAVVVATALQCPHLVIGEVLDELESARVATEEVLANEGTIFRLERLVVTIRR